MGHTYRKPEGRTAMSNLRWVQPAKRSSRRGRLAAAFLLAAAVAPAAWSAPLAETGTAVREPSRSPHRRAAVNPPAGITGSFREPARLAEQAATLEPQIGTAGVNIHGAVFVSWGPSGVRFQVDNITNDRSGGTSGTLRLDLWATTSVPVYGQTISTYTLGTFTLGQLPGGYEFNNVDSGFVSYSPPPTGCFYITVALQEYNGSVFLYDDLVTLTINGVPDGAGNVRFSFGGADCRVASQCVPDANTACLLNGRFRATVRFRNDFSDTLPDTAAFAKPVTGFASPGFETAFFYFNSPNNIELLLKMLDQGNTNTQGQPTIAVLFGTATPLRVELTITDTQTGAVRVYTSHFPSMAGKTDFTAFVK
jgi:hypothetical protein